MGKEGSGTLDKSKSAASNVDCFAILSPTEAKNSLNSLATSTLFQ